jgi:hypothetical protein
MIDLRLYPAIQSNLFVRIQVDEYRTSTGTGYTEEVLKFSDLLVPYTINEEEYHGIGRLMDITASSSELRSSSGGITITVSGIPPARIFEIVNSKIKGCPVSVYRVLFDPTTGEKIEISGNPMGRFRGFVNNYSLNEEFDVQSRTSSTTLTLVCSSAIDVLANKVGGRKTNPTSMKKFYPTDISFDRVPNLENSTFNFGAPL